MLDLTFAGIAITLAGIAVGTKGVIGSGIGLAFVNVISFNSNVKLLVNFWTQLETSIGAVSRIKTYAAETVSENLPAEDGMVPETWPTEGKIEIKDIVASYSLVVQAPPLHSSSNFSQT